MFGNRNSFACPACRKTVRRVDVKADFKTLSLMDTVEARTFLVTEQDFVKMCYLCKKKPVSKKCKQCVCMVCDDCGESHKFIPSCRNHDIQSLTDTVNKERQRLTSIKKALTRHNLEIQHKMNLLNHHKQSMDALYGTMFQEIEKWHTETQASIKAHFEEMVSSVERVQQEEQTELGEMEMVTASVRGPTEKYLENIDHALASQDVASFLGIQEKMHLDLGMNTIADRIRGIKMPQHPQVHVKKGQKWDSNAAMNVTITRKQPPIKTFVNWLIPKSQFCPLDLHMRELKKSPYAIKLNETPLQLTIHQDYLWCLLLDRIEIYNTFGTWINNISLEKYTSSANGMTIINNNLVIASLKSGLLQFRGSSNFVLRHVTGDFIQEILPGSFCDVTSDTSSIYTLDYTSKPYIKKYYLNVWKNWELLENVGLPYPTPSGLDTIVWNDAYVMVSSCAEARDGCILVYHSSCILLHRITHTKCVPRFLVPGIDGDVLCSNIMDRNSNLFVLRGHGTDRFDLQVCLGESKKRNMCAVFDKDKRLWLYNGFSEIICFNLV